MAEYIDFEQTLASLQTLINVTKKYADGQPEAIAMFTSGILSSIGMIVTEKGNAIEEAVPVIHALWRYEPDMPEHHEWVCSNCGEEPWWCAVDENILPPYCPHCGARMDQEAEE